MFAVQWGSNLYHQKLFFSRLSNECSVSPWVNVNVFTADKDAAVKLGAEDWKNTYERTQD